MVMAPAVQTMESPSLHGVYLDNIPPPKMYRAHMAHRNILYPSPSHLGGDAAANIDVEDVSSPAHVTSRVYAGSAAPVTGGSVAPVTSGSAAPATGSAPVGDPNVHSGYIAVRVASRRNRRADRVGIPPSGRGIDSIFNFRVTQSTASRSTRCVPRGTGRGGGCGGGSQGGRERSLGVHNEVTEGWRVDGLGTTYIQMETAFSEKAYSERSRAYGNALLSNVA